MPNWLKWVLGIVAVWAVLTAFNERAGMMIADKFGKFVGLLASAVANLLSLLLGRFVDAANTPTARGNYPIADALSIVLLVVVIVLAVAAYRRFGGGKKGGAKHP